MRKLATLLGLAIVAAAPSTEARQQLKLDPDLSEPLKAALQIRAGVQPRLQDAKPVGGAPVSIAENPWQVAIVYSTADEVTAFCGGSLVAERWVVTAAHCIGKMRKTCYQVVAGAANLDMKNLARISIAEAYVYPSYRVADVRGDEVQYDDIALLRLDGTPTGSIIPMAGQVENDALKGTSALFVTGWGATDSRTRDADPAGGSRTLNGVALLYVRPDDCADPVSYGKAITPQMLCAGHRDGGKDACNGDSGGPLSGKVGAAPHLFGVVSWGRGCALPEKYGVYTRIAAFRGWIDQCLAGGACPRKNA